MSIDEAILKLRPDVRLNVTEAASLLAIHVTHLRRLVRRGIFPAPRRTGKGAPFYDYDLMKEIAEIVARRVGVNGEEVMFRRTGTAACNGGRANNQSKTRQGRPARRDDYVEAIIDACRELGVPAGRLESDVVKSELTAEFGRERPPLEVAVPAIACRLLGDADWQN
jgi:imidazolonepropionase-like amidohydrolase